MCRILRINILLHEALPLFKERCGPLERTAYFAFPSSCCAAVSPSANPHSEVQHFVKSGLHNDIVVEKIQDCKRIVTMEAMPAE